MEHREGREVGEKESGRGETKRKRGGEAGEAGDFCCRQPYFFLSVDRSARNATTIEYFLQIIKILSVDALQEILTTQNFELAYVLV